VGHDRRNLTPLGRRKIGEEGSGELPREFRKDVSVEEEKGLAAMTLPQER
jgi:hypothetical protein